MTLSHPTKQVECGGISMKLQVDSLEGGDSFVPSIHLQYLDSLEICGHKQKPYRVGVAKHQWKHFYADRQISQYRSMAEDERS